jgi:hypothetical protein
MKDISNNPIGYPDFDILSPFYHQNYFFILLFVLAIYIIIFLSVGDSDPLSLSRSIDFIFILFSIIIFICYYYITNENERIDLINKLLIWTKESINNDRILTTLIIILFFYIIIYICQIPMTSGTKPIFINFVESILWISFFTLIINDGIKYLFDINLANLIIDRIIEYMKGFSIKKEVIVPVINPKNEREVFNISNNLYTYDDAQAICKSYNSRLATYDEVEESYNNGGEWCNYGWSENQMILFPTQKTTWNKLQTTKEHKNDCGRPGVNGGVISNPNMEFGVNCFGIKPAQKESDKLKMSNKSQNIPKSKDEIILDAKVKYWQENSDKLLTINSFNKDKWKEY